MEDFIAAIKAKLEEASAWAKSPGFPRRGNRPPSVRNVFLCQSSIARPGSRGEEIDPQLSEMFCCVSQVLPKFARRVGFGLAVFTLHEVSQVAAERE